MKIPNFESWRKENPTGTTLVELMVAVMLIGVVSVGIVGIFSTIGKSLHFSKTRSLAANLSQEQMQILKQKSFHQILVTTAAAYLTNFSPSVPYDTGYYPPESILEGGIKYTRYTYVQVAAEDSGTLAYYGNIPDTGMKAITVTVTWDQGSDSRKLQMRNIAGNIDTSMSNAVFRGDVTDSVTTNPIPGALVTIAENVGYSDTVDSNGAYEVNLLPGNYSIHVLMSGYFSIYRSVSIAPNESQTQDFTLSPMSSGTVTGNAWINDHLVISQVVGSSVNASGFCQEYVELFNPSTMTWTIASGPTTSVIDLMYQREGEVSPTRISMDYTNLTVDPNAYYLFANTTTITSGGIDKPADAVFQTSNAGYPDLIWVDGGDPCSVNDGGADMVGIAWPSPFEYIDILGWDAGATAPPEMETDGLDDANGLEAGEQFVRRSSTMGVTAGFGRAYDSKNNNVDFISYLPPSFPANTSSSTETVVSGTPAVGAYVTATDGLSQVTTATAVGSPPYAEFQLTPVATGTWRVFIASSNASLEISSVIVTASAQTLIPSADTDPTWPSSSFYSAVLSESASFGYVTGWVKDALGSPIDPAIEVTASGTTELASVNTGAYFLTLSTGTYDVIANQNNLDPTYVSVTSQTVNVELGQVSPNVDFTLTQGGQLQGYVTRDGINALPWVSVVALDSNLVAVDQQVSGTDGSFSLVNLSTGDYTVELVLGSGETSSPTSISATVTAGTAVDVGTFTVTGAFGAIRGNVTDSGSPIKTGVLIVCSTSVFSGGPPTISQSALTGGAIYTANSLEDGSYSVDVRGSTTTTYNVYAYYTTFNGSTPVIGSKNSLGVSVTAGATTTIADFNW